MYLSERGDWTHEIAELIHHGQQCLADHISISLKLKLKSAEGTPKTSYYKMDHRLLEDPNTLATAADIWDAHPWIRDSRKKWNLAWGRIRTFMRGMTKNQKVEDSRLLELQNQVAACRMTVTETSSPLNQELLQTAIDKLREREDQEARIWKSRSRSKWAEQGEAPTRYYFQLAKAKFARETITSLEAPDGTIKDEPRDIQRIIKTHYEELFREESTSEAALQDRRAALQLLQQRISEQQKNELEEEPLTAEVEANIAGMQDEKAPGIDGLTVEVVRKLWWKVKNNCMAMVITFWRKKEISERDTRGVIKLLPKSENRKLIKNWRPITLMTFTYKLVSRIMATRIKALVPNLVDQQQTGFVAGRNITENVLALKLGQEWAAISGQDAVFVKFDFMKAFDRVNHDYLWETLQQMNFGADTIRRIKRLVLQGSSTVHCNGAFTETKEEYFEAIREVIQRFEHISGARLNLQKSIVMPLTPHAGANWLGNTGCEIAGEGQDFTYLGVISGCTLDERKIADEIIRKVSSKISHWSTRWLAQPGRIILLKHILAAMLTYQLISVGMTEQGISGFEALCRNFIWGWNSEGNPKKALIAWWKVSLKKDDGGIGWTTIRAIALQMKNASHILCNKDCEWVDLAKSMIRSQLAKGSNRRERRFWSPQEALLLLTQLRIPKAPTQSPVDKPLQETKGWHWTGTEKGRFSWHQTSKFWSNLLYSKTPLADELSPRWQTMDTEDKWRGRWRRIWKVKLSYRIKLWWWKMYHKGFFTGRYAARINIDNGIYHSCRREVETMDHLWWQCTRGTRRNQQFIQLVIPPVDRGRIHSLLDLIDYATEDPEKRLSVAAATFALLRQRWNERCTLIFRKKRFQMPLQHILREALHESRHLPPDSSRKKC
ncbi:hypothetical protein R1sor_008935 [Riccia sorocarpa]|uniref:Reverse transcriptase domain-containing protein n=1 Tax=Riccia sorocarpa TaxID=122646 RepID=A0ABD3H690_9MARC